MTIITRFAPSPTGLLHIGNARTALSSFLYAKSHNGKFMLRIDDTDTERSKKEYEDSIINDLKWLGFQWDIFARQSERLSRYEEVKQQLISIGRIYPCYELPEEIEMKRKLLLSRGLPPIYDRAALDLTQAQIDALQAKGARPYWRFKMDYSKDIVWNDMIKGTTSFDPKNISDPVLIRANNMPTYMLPSTIDDIDFDISHIVRGEDHITNTAIQIQIFEALGANIPKFAHHSLMKVKDGKISKREGGFDIESLRMEGIEQMAIVSMLARLGTSDPIEPRNNMQQIVENFDISKFGKAPAIYDEEELKRFNAKIVHILDFAQVKTRPELTQIDEDFWQLIRGNLTNSKEVAMWHKICKQQITPNIIDEALCKQASDLLPTEKLDVNSWNIWTEKVKNVSGKKGKDLFLPLRLALTAEEHGPELKYILPIIGLERAKARLLGQVS